MKTMRYELRRSETQERTFGRVPEAMVRRAFNCRTAYALDLKPMTAAGELYATGERLTVVNRAGNGRPALTR